MFNIETVEDVKILKELTKNNDFEKIRALETEVEDLKRVVSLQTRTIKSLTQAKPLTKDDVKKIIQESIKTAPKKRRGRKKASTVNIENEEFKITPGLLKHKVVSPYNKIFVQGDTLIHKSATNHENILPITTIQFLMIVEKFTAGKNKIFNKDVQNICNLCDISKHQFAKIYYNLKEGNFFETIDTIHTQIKQTTFLYKNGFIFIKKGAEEYNTKIDARTFRRLVDIYVNSNTPYLTIYKLSREYSKDINPIFLLTVLRRNETILKLLEGKA